MESRTGRGAWIIALAAAVGIAISIYDYCMPATGLEGTEGVILTGAAGILMLGAALALMRRGTGMLATVLKVLILLDIIGTAVAGYFLESGVLIAAMLVALAGWLRQIRAKGEGK